MLLIGHVHEEPDDRVTAAWRSAVVHRLVYRELHLMASRLMAREWREGTIQTTGLGGCESVVVPGADRRGGRPPAMSDEGVDFDFPVESSQLPLFRLLGTPAEHKRHVIFEDAGHVPPRLDVIREILGWLDRYLGPVKRRRP